MKAFQKKIDMIEKLFHQRRSISSSIKKTKMNFNSSIDFDIKSPDEIRQMTELLRSEIERLQNQKLINQQKIAEGRENVRKLIPNVSEFQEIATRRTEALDKIRRLEKKIISCYNRFPEMLNADQPQIISTDMSILERHLESIRNREQTAAKQIEELKLNHDRLEQSIVELKRQNRNQRDVMAQRDQDKAQLVQSLKQELDASKTLYLADTKTIEKKTGVAESISQDLVSQFASLKQQYEALKKQRAQIIQKAPQQNALISQRIAQRQDELIRNTENFVNWWCGRRMLKHYTDRIDFLSGVKTKTQERYEQSYKSIELIKRNNVSKIAELKSLRNMNQQLNITYKEKEERNNELDNQKSILLKSFKPLPRDVDQKLKSLREQNVTLTNKAKSLDIELQVLGVNGPSRSEVRYEDARRHYRSQIQTAARLRKSNEELRKNIEAQKIGQKRQFVAPLTTIQDSRLLLSDEPPYVVIAASLDLLEFLIFHPGNEDPDFLAGVLVYVHTEKIDLQSFVQALISFYNNSEFVQSRDERLKRLIEIWRKWFPDDFSDAKNKLILSPLINFVGVSGIYDVQQQARSNFKRTEQVPFNAKETKIAFMASPLIIAEHFSYQELLIIKSIQASEFVGCGWTASDKWQRAPNIMKMMDHFNSISQWIVFTIVDEANLTDRIALLERWIQIMDAANEIINFQLVFEIYAALCNPAVTHLKSTWDGVSPENMELYRKYANLASASSRFANYRKELEQHCPETVIPYIGPFLTSLVYISDGNPSKKTLPNYSDPVVNFQKFRSYASVLNEIMVPWGKDMVFYLHEDLLKCITTIPPVELSESELFQKAQSYQ